MPFCFTHSPTYQKLSLIGSGSNRNLKSAFDNDGCESIKSEYFELDPYLVLAGRGYERVIVIIHSGLLQVDSRKGS